MSVTMNAEASRRGACDRCRGQKLRCVGAAKPIFNPVSRFLRNEVPCDRCKRAKVECYSVRPAPRRITTSERAQDTTPDSQLAQERNSRGSNAAHAAVQFNSNSTTSAARHDPLPDQHQPRNSVSTHYTQRNLRQPRDADLPSAMQSAMTNDWSSYPTDDDMDWNDVNLETPGWMLDTDRNVHPDSIMDNTTDPSLIELMSKPPSVDWSPRQFAADVNSVNTESSSSGKLSSQTRRSSPLVPTQNTETTRTIVQELAKLNEKLLREKNNLEETSGQDNVESGTQSIGHTLQHCREFLSILQRLRQSHCDSDSGGIREDSRWLIGVTDMPDIPSSRCGSSTLSVSSKSSLASPPNAIPALEIPTLLSILSCYAYILQSYDHVLTPILESLTQPTPSVPPILSGIRLDGFELDGDYVLQLECLTSVSFNMLEKIESILIGSSRQSGIFNQARGGLLRDKLVSGWIDVLYDQDEHPLSPHRGGKREVRAKRLIREIQAALKVID